MLHHSKIPIFKVSTDPLSMKATTNHKSTEMHSASTH